jgi:uncharacterized membrane protein
MHFAAAKCTSSPKAITDLAMQMSLAKKIAYSLVLLSFVTAIYFYPILPEKVASHWNLSGNADGQMEKWVALFLTPVLSLAFVALFELVPRIDPLRKNYAKFASEYDGMLAALVAFMSYLFGLTILYNIDYRFNMTQALSPAFAMLFFYLGMVLQKAKRNWFIGIRTPWTMSSERVWDRTHALGGKIFKAAGIVALLGVVMPEVGLMASVAIMIAAAVATVIYSYVEFGKEKTTGKKAKRR